MMKRFLLITSLLVLSAHVSLGQSTPGTIRFPDNLDDQDSLIRVKDNSRALLSVSMTTGSAQITVDNTASFAATGVLQIDNEQISYTAKTSTSFSGLGRGAFGTTAASHTMNTSVRGVIAAIHHTVIADALRAVEAKLGTGSGLAATNEVLMGNGAGASIWSPMTKEMLPLTLRNNTQITNPVFFGGSATGLSLTDAVLNNPTFTNLNLAGTTTAHIINADVVNATTLIGNGAGVTGVLSVGAGTGISSTGGLTFRADSNSSGSDGVMDFQGASGATAFRINPDNKAYFTQMLGIGVTNPTSPITIATTPYAAPVANAGVLIRLKAQDATTTDFTIGTNATQFNGFARPVNSTWIGWNYNGGQVREKTSDTGLGFYLEQGWHDGNPTDGYAFVDEVHLTWDLPNGHGFRPFTWYLNRDTEQVNYWHRADESIWFPADGLTYWMKLNTTELHITKPTNIFNALSVYNSDSTRAFKLYGNGTGDGSIMEFFNSDIQLRAGYNAPAWTPSAGGSAFMREGGGGGLGRSGSALYAYDETAGWQPLSAATRYGTASVTFSAIAAGAVADVAGATVDSNFSPRDSVQCAPDGVLDAGLMPFCYVNNSDHKVHVRLLNGSGSTITPTAQVWRFSVMFW
jgi:hypothetical protein